MKKRLDDSIRAFFNVANVKKAFRISSDLASAVSPVIEKPKATSILGAAFAVGNVLMAEFELWPDDYFNEDWDTPYGVEFYSLLSKAIQHKPYRSLKTSDKTLEIRLATLQDPESKQEVTVGYTFNVRNGDIDRFCVKSEEMAAARKAIKHMLWSSMPQDNIIMRYSKQTSRDSCLTVQPDDAFMPMPSARAIEYTAYLKRCIDAGVNRSVMLYGPPGTGKSTMARTIIDALGFKSFRIRVEDIGHMETSTVFDAINVFEPDAIILDDFDRSSSQMALLETLEYFHNRVKLIIATVNNRNNLDEAIMRPGRFDELLHVKQMDEDVVKAILGDAHADALPIVKDWPVAFIQEYVKRRQFMGTEEAAESISELAQRVQRLESYDDPIDKMVSRPFRSSRSSEKFAQELKEIFPNIKRRRKRD